MRTKIQYQDHLGRTHVDLVDTEAPIVIPSYQPRRNRTMNNVTNIFEYALRNKIRFQSTKGGLTLEQLWDVPLRSNDDFNLNSIAKAASSAMKNTAEDFVNTTKTTPEHARNATAFEIVKYVIDVKLAEEEAAKNRAERKKEKEALLNALAEKQEGKLSKLSEAQLKARIEALDQE